MSAAVDAVVPLIEICDTRLSEWRTRRIEEITADNAFNGGVVVGTAFEAWRNLDLATHRVTLSVDGALKGEGTGALVLGHPLVALTWLANEMSRRGDGLRAGNWSPPGPAPGCTSSRRAAQSRLTSVRHSARSKFTLPGDDAALC